MHKVPSSRSATILGMAVSLGMLPSPYLSTASVLNKKRGKAGPGRRWVSGCYVPGGPNPNVEPTLVRNPKIAAHVRMMHEKWLAARAERSVRYAH